MVAIAPLRPLFTDVDRIAVLRGGGIGDLLFALPAIDALAAAYPGARILLLGTPAHRALLAELGSPVDEVVVLPFARGLREGGPEDPDAVDAIVERMRALRLDLAVQVHGGGRYSNPFLARLGARHTVGCRTPDADPLERELPYLYYQHEMLRALEVVGLAGAEAVRLEPALAVPERLRERARAVLPAGPGPLVVLHPGATDPRRRWPAERFGAVARELLADGARVVVVGDATDREAGERILAAAPGAHSLVEALDLGGLAGVLAEADLVVGNDSGPRHLAAAVGAPTVGVFWFGNAVNAAPLGRGRHRIRLSWTTHCPVCGRDATQVGWTAERCPHDDSFVADVPVAGVLEDARALLAG